jgi:hypothetical protein
MRIKLTLLLALAAVGTAQAQQCDCKSYPFKPERCFEECVKKLSAQPAIAIDQVKDLDPGVSLSLRVLSQNRTATTIPNLDGVRSKGALERAALESIKRTER